MTNYNFKAVTVTKVIPKHQTMISEDIFTKMELLVLQKIIEGFTHDEISAQVFRSKRTVDGYADSIRNKMDCSSNVQVVVKALNEGLFIINSKQTRQIVFLYL
jgi:DNA-binding NarL/FixJ family response regulator